MVSDHLGDTCPAALRFDANVHDTPRNQGNVDQRAQKTARSHRSHLTSNI